ncbi:phosphoribosylformylglycinamidine synthase subunit PurQ [Baekduia soli]|uniref:Phosphoribosylformylglycinamidine synthase subunit PurQ n=1 Tax=Baekduia soli TaxID=496014 RepID=A0A5B8U1X8_9ACTN|nr:phosphoribosylformylglycinamidine synthase subunit PurQ [Baekduia soli]QEC47003.1 phosphoribosylformylglycinamidine synthase subunit PurQ [Baekduia soli]
MKLGVVTFPGTCDDADARIAAGMVAEAVPLWHRDADLRGVDGIIVPGGFSYGDYLRAGAIARFSPVMESVVAFARDGGPVLGICNGFQILCEAGLLPGALLPNTGLRFVCRQVDLVVQTTATPFTSTCTVGQVLSIPAKHTTGRYFGEVAPEQVVLRYAHGHNFNGSQDDIAGVVNAAGNVMGLMPHPEHAVETLTGGSADGLALFEGMTRVAVA